MPLYAMARYSTPERRHRCRRPKRGDIVAVDGQALQLRRQHAHPPHLVAAQVDLVTLTNCERPGSQTVTSQSTSRSVLNAVATSAAPTPLGLLPVPRLEQRHLVHRPPLFVIPPFTLPFPGLRRRVDGALAAKVACSSFSFSSSNFFSLASNSSMPVSCSICVGVRTIWRNGWVSQFVSRVSQIACPPFLLPFSTHQ